MRIDWWTFALQAINFLVLVWLLWRFLYQPVKEVIEKRKALAEQAFREADDKKQEAEAARRHFEEGQAQLAEERRDMLQKVHQELEDERNKIVEAARNEAGELLENARLSIEGERDSALKEIREQAASLATELAGTLLEKSGAGALNGAFLEQLDKELAALPADERDRLVKDLSMNGARLRVVTAAPLAPKDQDRWRKRLSAHLGLEDKADFAVDPAILGGAELRFPHAVLSFTWAEQLRKAKELMGKNDDAS